jgi:uncharacterized repeat protein (TIGR01451 family)
VSHRFRLLAALPALLLLLVVAPAGTAQATITITPLLDCVTFDSSTDLVTAYFGYDNPDTATHIVPIGTDNLIMPAPSDRGQATTFLPGVHHDVFSVPFDVTTTPTLRWSLTGNSAVASNDSSLYCAEPPADASLSMPDSLATTVGTDVTLSATVADPSVSSGDVFGNLVYNLPPGLVAGTLPSGSPCTASGSQVTCAVSPGSGSQVPVHAASPGSYPVVGTLVAFAHGDPAPDNNVATTTVLVTGPPVATTGLAGSVTATAATLTGTVDPAGADTTVTFSYWPDGQPGLLQTLAGSDAGSGFGPVPVQASVIGLLPGTTYDYTLSATNAVGDSSPTAQQSFATPPAVSGLALSATGPAGVPVGSPVTTTFTVSNAGPDPATGVRLTVQLPAAATVVSLVPAAGACTVTGTAPVVTCVLGGLASGNSVDVAITATAAKAGSLVMSGFVVGDQPDPSPADNSATKTIAVTAARPVNLTVAMSAPTSAHKGRAFTVKLTIRNLGPGTANRVLLDLPFPASAKVTALRATRGTCTAGAAPACALGNLASGAVVTVTATVVPGALGRLVLPADVRSASPESRPADNRTQRTVLVTQ